MPPKPRFQQDQILYEAMHIIRQEGVQALTARKLAQHLHCSVCPIFTIYENMDALLAEAKQAAKALYRDYVKQGLTQTPAFKGVGTQYIRFAMEEPYLFQWLFMSEQSKHPAVNRILENIEESYDEILASIENEYELNPIKAKRIYRHLWIYTHGIAVLCATHMCTFETEEISQMMSEVFISLLKQIKGV